MPDATEENPKIVNLVQPMEDVVLNTPSGPVHADMVKLTEVCASMGIRINKGDVLSIGAIKNARGIWTPDYSTIRVERRAPQEEDDE